METLSTQYHQVFFKNKQEGVGISDFMTTDLYLGQVKGQPKISYKTCLGTEPSIMVGMNFAQLFLGLHNLYIHLSFFSLIFCHISMTACHMMHK